MKMKPAIVVSTHISGLGIIRALGIHQVPVIAVHYDEGDIGYLSKYVMERIRAPNPENFENQFVEFLLDGAPRLGGSLLIPSSDAALATVSRHKSVLQSHYIVACPEWQITEQFLDKQHTYPLAAAVGVPAPRTMVVKSIEEVEREGKRIEYPCIVKPTKGHLYHTVFKRKMVRADNFAEVAAAYRQAAAAGLEVMIQELIPGEDSHGVNYNSYFRNGEPLVEFTAAKVRNATPAFGSPRVVVSKHIPEVFEAGRRLLQAGRFYGYSCTEFKKDIRDGVYKLMEVNGRHNLSSFLAVQCGLNFAWMQYKHLVGGYLPSARTYRTGVYWIDLTRDVGNSVKNFKKENYSLRDYIRPYFQPHVLADFDWKDLRPFVKRCLNLVKKATQAVRRQQKMQFPSRDSEAKRTGIVQLKV